MTKNSAWVIVWIMVLSIFLLGACIYRDNELDEEVRELTSTSIQELPSTTASPTLRKETANTTTETDVSVPLPTLTTDERLVYTQELFQTNANCDLPCWWGFSPGKTNWIEVENFLHHIGASTSPQLINDDWVYHGTGGFDYVLEGSVIGNRIGFLEKDGLIELIYISSEGYSNPAVFQEQWMALSPDRLLRKYGVPTRVLLEASSSGPVAEGRIAGYTLWIFYDQLGFLILYEGYGEYESIYNFCPRFENGEDIRFLELFLQSPDNHRSIEEIAGIIGFDSDSYTNVLSIQEAAGLSTDDFYNLFLQEDKEACVETSRDIWP